jgi:hypothetical protein
MRISAWARRLIRARENGQRGSTDGPWMRQRAIALSGVACGMVTALRITFPLRSDPLVAIGKSGRRGEFGVEVRP